MKTFKAQVMYTETIEGIVFGQGQSAEEVTEAILKAVPPAAKDFHILDIVEVTEDEVYATLDAEQASRTLQ